MKKEIFSNPLLLVIDMQNVYGKAQKWECQNYEKALSNIIKLLEKNNAIFTKYIADRETPVGIWKNYNIENVDVIDDEWLNELDSHLLDEYAAVRCYDKSVYSAYKIKEVRDAAEQSSCVIVTGVVAECCVLSTVMDLIDAGIYVIYAIDAVAGINDVTESATIKVLEGLSPLHVKMMMTEKLIKALA